MSRAWTQLGEREKELIEIDVKRGAEHDMLLDSGPYSALLRAVWEDRLKGLVGGPNCRTRSIMRHYPVEWGNSPSPLRRWGNDEEFGIKDATPEEAKKLLEDDCLLWRMIFIAMLDSYLKEARGIQERMCFGLEQPASPKNYTPEVVSFWDTKEWALLKEEFGWNEKTFQQKPLGGAAVKPTTVAGSVVFFPEAHKLGVTHHVTVKGSWELARWPPGMMNMMAEALMRQGLHRPPQLKALSWSEHIAMGHTPARRDCRVCQENQQQCSPHRRVKHKLAGDWTLQVLSSQPMTREVSLAGTSWWVP